MENEPLGKPKFSTYNDSDGRTQESMYFCSDDEVTSENVKVGTFQSAEKNCEEILLPRICDDESMADKVRDLAIKAQERRYISTHTVYIDD